MTYEARKGCVIDLPGGREYLDIAKPERLPKSVSSASDGNTARLKTVSGIVVRRILKPNQVWV